MTVQCDELSVAHRYVDGVRRYGRGRARQPSELALPQDIAGCRVHHDETVVSRSEEDLPVGDGRRSAEWMLRLKPPQFLALETAMERGG